MFSVFTQAQTVDFGFWTRLFGVLPGTDQCESTCTIRVFWRRVHVWTKGVRAIHLAPVL